MTTAQFEERLVALEQTVEELKAQIAAPCETKPAANEDEFIPGAEYPIVLAVPPKEEFHFRGRIVSIERGPQELSLSDAEWASL